MAIFLITQAVGTWPQWGGDPTHLAFQMLTGAVATPSVKWSFVTGNPVEYQFSAVADVDGDGAEEVVFQTSGGYLYCLSGDSGTEEWSVYLGSGSSGSPAVADVDGDGNSEVIVGTQDAKIYCISGLDGSQKWLFNTSRGVSSAPTVADVDLDGQPEVLVPADSGSIYCLSGVGSQEWEYSSGAGLATSPVVGDVDKDEVPEVVFGTSTGEVFALAGESGELQWSFSTASPVLGPILADLGPNGTMEVFFGSADTVYCLSGRDGSVIWRFGAPEAVSGTPSAADADGDRQIEIVFGSGNEVLCLDGSGAFQWSAVVPSTVSSPGTFADVDGDRRLEYLVPQALSDTLYCLNAENGSMLWKISLGVNVYAPFAADIDDDGCVEVLVGTGQPGPGGARFFVIDDPGDYGNCGFSAGEMHQEDAPNMRQLGRNLVLTIPIGDRVSLALYDPSGRVLERLYEGFVPAGTHVFALDLRSSGVYYAVLRWPKGMISQKVIY